MLLTGKDNFKGGNRIMNQSTLGAVKNGVAFSNYYFSETLMIHWQKEISKFPINHQCSIKTGLTQIGKHFSEGNQHRKTQVDF